MELMVFADGHPGVKRAVSSAMDLRTGNDVQQNLDRIDRSRRFFRDLFIFQNHRHEMLPTVRFVSSPARPSRPQNVDAAAGFMSTPSYTNDLEFTGRESPKNVPPAKSKRG